MFNVELGDEAIIPAKLMQRDLSQCYRFYNPILNIIEDMCQFHKKTMFIEKNNQLLKMAQIEVQSYLPLIRKLQSKK